MRIKSNYGTIDPYLVARITASDHETFNRALCLVTRATLGLLELYVLRRIGKDQFAQIASEFIRQDGADLSKDTLRPRLHAFGLVAVCRQIGTLLEPRGRIWRRERVLEVGDFQVIP